MSIATQLQDELYGSGAGGVNLYGDGIFSSIFNKGASLLAKKGAGAGQIAAKAAKKALSRGAINAKNLLKNNY